MDKGSYSNGVFTVGALAVGERVTINIVARADATGSFTNVASVKGDQYDHNLANNNASKALVVNPSCDLAIVKSANASSINYGKLVKWTLTVTNNGPDAASGSNHGAHEIAGHNGSKQMNGHGRMVLLLWLIGCPCGSRGNLYDGRKLELRKVCWC